MKKGGRREGLCSSLPSANRPEHRALRGVMGGWEVVLVASLKILEKLISKIISPSARNDRLKHRDITIIF